MKFSMKAAGLPVLVVAVAPLLSSVASAIDVSVSGFIRQEMAYKISNDENPTSRGGSKFNGTTTLLDGPFVSNPAGVLQTQEDKSIDNDWNVFATKAELDFNINISNNWTAFVKVRGYYQPDMFETARWRGIGENGGDFNDDTNHFGVKNHSNGEAGYLSYSEDNYMIDLPSLYFDYAKGPLWVRIGQQQIAWGEALFFRVADVANGLDLRRHLFFDFGAEEYADERLSAPGVRATYRLNDTWEFEAFAQMFQPSVLPTRGSPYSLILSGFSQNYHDAYQKVDDQINAGVRILGTFGDLGVQFFAVSRHNPDPIFALGRGGQTDGPFGAAFSEQPFVYGGFPDGVQGDGTDRPEAWFYHTGIGGLDGTAVINRLAEEWPVIKATFEGPFGLTADANGDYFTTVDIPGSGPNGVSSYDILGAFYEAGSIDGPLDATYAAEDVFGFGLNYIVYAEPDSLFDQLVIRFEASFTPDKKFTNPNLGKEFLVEDEWVTSFILEKYHRFSNEFPATFFIFEWMHKSESDLLGRHLSGLGGDERHRPGGGEDDRGWDGLVFAFQQPLPNLTWRIDLSVLYDTGGGIYVQPAVRYKPSSEWTVEAFANIIDSKDNASIFATTDWSDDFTMRITYQF